MTTLGEQLTLHTDEIVQRWYEAWRRSSHPTPELSERTLKDRLPLQLRLIGEQLQELSQAEAPQQLWKTAERLDPEERVQQDLPIEEVVKEYGLVVDVVRAWLEEHDIEVSFQEYSYFYGAVFELVAESVRRYATHEAEKMRQARAHYLARVMHQIRSPLSALTMQLDLLERGAQKADDSVLARMRRNARRIRGLVESILRLERYEPWEVPVQPTEARPAQLVEFIRDDYELEATRKGLRFETRIEPSLSMSIDSELFLDALGNLVQNAVKYTQTGYVTVDAVEHAEDVAFCVRDSGPGMSAEEQSTLFDQPQPGSASGTGIGLLIARHAAEAQGGRIDVKSEKGKGSVFSLVLPRVVTERSNTKPDA